MNKVMRCLRNSIVLFPIVDFWRTRRRPVFIVLIPVLASGIIIFSNLRLEQIWLSSFISTQINIIAILISFSIASIAIIVSSSSNTIATLREQKTDDSTHYRTINEKPLSLFQILLSNIIYNIETEILYLAILILQCFYNFETACAIRIVVSIDIFLVFHVLCVLLTAVYHLYLVFWTDITDKKKDHNGNGDTE